MKNKIIFALVSIFALAARSSTSDVKKELLLDIKEETKKCVAEIVNVTATSSEISGYESSCSTLKILSDRDAQVFIDGQWYNLHIAEAPESDGGDLDDLFVYNADGLLVAQRNNCPAYDSVVRAMAGDSVLRQKPH